MNQAQIQNQALTPMMQQLKPIRYVFNIRHCFCCLVAHSPPPPPTGNKLGAPVQSESVQLRDTVVKVLNWRFGHRLLVRIVVCLCRSRPPTAGPLVTEQADPWAATPPTAAPRPPSVVSTNFLIFATINSYASFKDDNLKDPWKQVCVLCSPTFDLSYFD